MAVAGLVLGIVSLIIPYINCPAGIVGIILSVMGMKQLKAENKPTGIATAGLVLSIVGTVLGFIIILCTIGIIVSAAVIQPNNYNWLYNL